MSITLLCLVKEDFIINSFSVKISKNEPVSELKKVIKVEKYKTFHGVEADKLKLWKVEIGGNHINDKLNNLTFHDSDELSAINKIGDYWAEKPLKKHIHIIVVPPASDEILRLSKSEYGYDNLKQKVPSVCYNLPYTPRQGGIGGTIFLTTEGGGANSYEGIDLSSPDICRREQTIYKLVEKIKKAHFLLVRSPPMFGKTSLAQLLDQHLVKDSSIRTIRISILWMGNPNGSWTFEDEFQRLMGITWKKFQDECVYIKTIFIVDEVQMLYMPQGETETASHHNGNVFWETIKRCQQIGNLHIVAFAAYGYKGAWNFSSAIRTIDVSPYVIPRENTWGIEDVRFTKDEYEDYFLRFCRKYLKKMKDKNDIRCLQEYVHNTTACHPGLVAFFMNHIKDHFSSQLKYDDKLTFKKIFLYLKSYRFMMAVDEGFRGYLYVQNLTQEEKDLCDLVFRGPVDIRELNNISKEEIRLVKTNLLSEQNDKRFYERAWQIEFYRAATQTLPHNVFISPDVGTKFGTRGHIDFFVNDGQSWRIELLWDDENASDHKSHFNDNYKSIRKACKEWAIIDIRNPDLCNQELVYDDDKHWINIYCQKDWKSVIIKDENEELVKVQLMGGEDTLKNILS
ncbi:hypothetical protein C1646_794910 [Rhizophagus diaphanus]|nr:hypothetical protein C1646_794910 [Rhizophagus diaphanus] [Rhizophagus sp. MUCL 43196]